MHCVNNIDIDIDVYQVARRLRQLHPIDIRRTLGGWNAFNVLCIDDGIRVAAIRRLEVPDRDKGTILFNVIVRAVWGDAIMRIQQLRVPLIERVEAPIRVPIVVSIILDGGELYLDIDIDARDVIYLSIGTNGASGSTLGQFSLNTVR